jgi:gas vesicle protein
MASTLDFIKEKFPKLSAFSDQFVASSLYKRNFEGVQDEFDSEEDYINFLMAEEPQEVERFGRRTDLVSYPEDQTTTMGEDFVGGLKKGIAGLKSTGYGILAGTQGLIGDEEDQEYYLQKAREAELAQAQIVPGYQSSKQAYESEGIGGLTGHLLQNFGLSAPEMAQGIAGSYAGGKAGAAIGTVFGGPIGTAIGGTAGAIIGGTIALAPSFFGRNILRQDQSVRAGEKVDINEFQALMTAPAQAAADAALYAILPRALKGTTSKNLFRKALKGGVVGVPTEAATEVFQQFLERAQAGGLDYATSEEALNEYAEAGFVGGTIGGVVGGVTGPLTIPTQPKTLKEQLADTTNEARANQTKPPIDDDFIENIDQEETDISQPTIPERTETVLPKEEVKTVQNEAKIDSEKSFDFISGETVDKFLNEKIQTIVDTQGEAQAKEYYKTFQKEYFKKRGLPAPTFEQITRKVKLKPKGPQIGQPRYETDEVKTDQFIDGKGFVVRDNKRDGEDSLAFRTEQEALSYIEQKESPVLTKEDVLIPEKPAEGFAWDSDKQQWVDKWEGQRGTEELADLTEAELRAAKVVKDKKGKETFTAGAINLTDLTPKQRRLLFENRNRKNFRKDPEKFNFTDLKELKDAGVIPKDARFIANLTPKQRKLLKDRRETNKDQIYTTNKELGELGVIGGTEVKADVETQVKESIAEENETFDVGFELKPVLVKESDTVDGKKFVRDDPTQKFEVIKVLKEKGTDRVVQEKVDSIHDQENVASARLRYLQKQNNVEVDIYAGEPVINSKELVERSPELGSMAIFVNDVINKISPTTNVLFATDKIVAPEGSLGFSTSEETVGDIQGWYDQAGDTIYLSLQNLEGMLDTNGRPTSKMLELVSHESFHALQRTIGNLKKKGVFTEKEQKALNEAFAGGKIQDIPKWVQDTLGTDAMDYLSQRYGDRNLDPEEMQAYVFQAWNAQTVAKKRPPVGNIIQRAFKKIAEIFTKTKRFVQGKGYNTFESVFKLASEGKVGRRGLDFKTQEEAEAFGQQRAEELEVAKDVPTRTDVDFEKAKDRKLVDALDVGERVITPSEAQYSVAPTTVYPKSNVRGTINSNNPIFKPLGFRPSQEAMSILNNAADIIVETKKGKVPQTETEKVKRSADMQPAYNEINNFKNKLISEKPEQVNEDAVREMLQPMVNAAVAVRHGHRFNITDPNTGDSVTIGSGEVLTGEDANIHKELSNVRVNRKPLYRAIRETNFRGKDEQQVQRADIEKDEVAERSATRAEKLLKDRQIEGTTQEEITEQEEQRAAAEALGIEVEGKPKRPILKLKSKDDVKFSVAPFEESTYSVLPIAQRNLEKFGYAGKENGFYRGKDNAGKEKDITGKTFNSGRINVNSQGIPAFNVGGTEVETDIEKTTGEVLVKTNLFKKSAGWKWTDKPTEGNEKTLVSVETLGKHYYTLNADFNKPVNLRRYDTKSEPRLRPTAYVNKEEFNLGKKIGEINVRGVLHPVYETIDIGIVQAEPKFSVDTVSIRENPPTEKLKLTRDLGKYFDDMTQPTDPMDDKAFNEAVDSAAKEIEYQKNQVLNGIGWYSKDAKDTFDLLSEALPTLETNPHDKDLFGLMTAITSVNRNPRENVEIASRIYYYYNKHGVLPIKNPTTNKFWSMPGVSKQLTLLQYMLDTLGVRGTIDFVKSEKTIRELAQVQRDSGKAEYGNVINDNYKANSKPSLGTGKGLDTNVLGTFIFGPKVGRFYLDIKGIKDNSESEGVTKDVWFSRSFYRLFGQLTDNTPSSRDGLKGGMLKKHEKRADEFAVALAKKVGLTPNDAQAALWYYEHELYADTVKQAAKLYTLSDGAKKYINNFKENKYGEIKSESSSPSVEVGNRIERTEGTRKEQTEEGRTQETKVVDDYIKGPDANLEAEGKETVVDIVPETGQLYSTESLMGNNNDEGIVSMSDVIMDDRVKSGLARIDKTYVSKLDKLRKKYPKLGGWIANSAIELRMGAQDKGYGTRRILDAVERKLGMKLTDPALEKKYGLIDPYIAEELFHGRTGERLAELQTLRIEPIIDTLEKNKIPIGDLDLYLYAKHAKERNASVYNKWKNGEKGFENLTEEEAKTGSGMTDEQADIILSDFKKQDNFKILEDISKQVSEMMRSNLETKFDGGLISEELRDQLLNQFENYVPLRGIDYEMDAEEVNWKLGVPIKRTDKKLKVTKPPGFQVRKEGREAKIGRGRGILDENIREARNTFAQAMIQLHNDIVRAERNRVAKSLYDFAKYYESEIDPNTDGLWTIMEDPTKPEQAETIEEFTKLKEEFRREKGRLKGKWKAKNLGEPFKFIIDGKEKVMLLENEYLARFFNNIGAQSGNMFTNALGRVTRYLAMINTGYNPEFVVANLLRDLQTAAINISDEQTSQLRSSMFKNWKSALKGAYNVERKADAQGQWETIYRNYKNAGGKVGFFTSIRTLEDQLNEIQGQLGDLNTEKKSSASLKKGSKFVKTVGKYISDVNAAVENAVRVSAFQSALDAGLSQTQAASLAKNLTVNFNRKGEWGSLINSMYLFYNASIQGSVRVLQASFRSPKIRKILYTITAGSFALDMLNRVAAGEDEDGRNRYDKLSGWVKSHNLILFLPGTEKYVAIPMPYGYNVMAVLGQTMASSMPEDLGGSSKQQVSVGDNASRTVGSMFNAFNPIGGSASVLEFVSPTVLKPAVQLMNNEDYAGRSIYPPDNPFDGNAGPPDSQRFWNASSISQTTASTLNSLTGGNKVEKGFIDFSPETMDFWFGHLFGGLGSFTGRTTELGKNILTGQWDEIGPNQVPFTRRVFKSQPTFVNKQAYFDIRDEVKIAENLIEYHIEEGNRDALIKIRKERRGLLRLQPIIKSVESQRRKIRQQIKLIENSKLPEEKKKEKIKRFLDRESVIIERFIKRADRILG